MANFLLHLLVRRKMRENGAQDDGMVDSEVERNGEWRLKLAHVTEFRSFAWQNLQLVTVPKYSK